MTERFFRYECDEKGIYGVVDQQCPKDHSSRSSKPDGGWLPKGTQRIALHQCRLPSGYRSSLPHAESHKEEFLFILEGQPQVWINGNLFALKPYDAVAFPQALESVIR